MINWERFQETTLRAEGKDAVSQAVEVVAFSAFAEDLDAALLYQGFRGSESPLE